RPVGLPLPGAVSAPKPHATTEVVDGHHLAICAVVGEGVDLDRRGFLTDLSCKTIEAPGEHWRPDTCIRKISHEPSKLALHPCADFIKPPVTTPEEDGLAGLGPVKLADFSQSVRDLSCVAVFLIRWAQPRSQSSANCGPQFPGDLAFLLFVHDSIITPEFL